MTIRLQPTNRIRPQTQRAFTLIELLLVLVILGILAAIVVPKFSGRTEQAQAGRSADADRELFNRTRCLRGGQRLLSQGQEWPERFGVGTARRAEAGRGRI